MSTEKNKELVRKAYGLLGQAPLPEFFNYLAEDVEWIFSGSHVFSGVFKGKKEIEEGLIAPMLKVLTSSRFEMQNLLAEGNQVVVEGQGYAPAKDGRVYSNTYCIVVTIKDDKIIQMREYLDTELITSFFGT